jgi:hypothetical protein
LRKIMLPLFLLLIIAFSFTATMMFQVNAEEAEFPHVEASKTVTPSKVEKDGTVEVTISLRGAGGVIPTPVDVVLILDRSGSMLGVEDQGRQGGRQDIPRLHGREGPRRPSLLQL